MRMVRFDSYRLASVVERYAFCTLALHSRLSIDPSIDRLLARQAAMKNRLEGAISHLEETHKRRKQAGQGYATLSNIVERYVESVLAKSRSIVERIENSQE